jgi:predicted transcriptional regulator
MKKLKVGIASRGQYRKRTMEIARGKYVPGRHEPKVWFDSLGTLSQVLSDQNRNLLKLILETQPESLQELAERSGRAASNLSRTLKTLERYGLVRFEKGENRRLAPRVNYSGVELELSFGAKADWLAKACPESNSEASHAAVTPVTPAAVSWGHNDRVSRHRGTTVRWVFPACAVAATVICLGVLGFGQQNPLENTQPPQLNFRHPTGPFGLNRGMTKQQVIERIGKDAVIDEKPRLAGRHSASFAHGSQAPRGFQGVPAALFRFRWAAQSAGI